MHVRTAASGPGMFATEHGPEVDSERRETRTSVAYIKPTERAFGDSSFFTFIERTFRLLPCPAGADAVGDGTFPCRYGQTERCGPGHTKPLYYCREGT